MKSYRCLYGCSTVSSKRLISFLLITWNSTTWEILFERLTNNILKLAEGLRVQRRQWLEERNEMEMMDMRREKLSHYSYRPIVTLDWENLRVQDQSYIIKWQRMTSRMMPCTMWCSCSLQFTVHNSMPHALPSNTVSLHTSSLVAILALTSAHLLYCNWIIHTML